MVARRPRLGADSRFSELVEGWLFCLGTTKPAAATVAAYRRDLVGVARRLGPLPRDAKRSETPPRQSWRIRGIWASALWPDSPLLVPLQRINAGPSRIVSPIQPAEVIKAFAVQPCLSDLLASHEDQD